MCNLCANKITITKEILNNDEEILDVRGKKFLKQVKKLTKIFRRYFDNMAEDAIKEASKNILLTKTEEEDRFTEWKQDFNIELEKTYIIGANFQEEQIQKQIAIGLSIGISDDKAKEYAQSRIGEFISKVDDETRLEIRNIINNGMEKQKTLKEVSDDIQTQFSQFSERRATLIAKTEASLAYAYGQTQQFEGYTKEFGAPGWKRVQTQGDDKVRESHRDAEDKGWVPYNHIYDDSDGQMQLSNVFPPFGFNCRCVGSCSLFNPDTGSIW